MKQTKIFKAAVLLACIAACGFFIRHFLKLNTAIEDGEYYCQVSLEGGSGKASVESPAKVWVSGETYTVKLVWSSIYYDYMLVDGARYDNEAAPGDNSVFTIPFSRFNTSFSVIGDTTAMSTPHEIEYELTVYAPEYDGVEENTTATSEATVDNTYDLGGLELVDSLELQYATQFSVDFYEDAEANSYKFIKIGNNESPQFILVGDTKNKPEGISENITYINDVDKTYLVSTSVMDLLVTIDALDSVKFSGTDSKDWYIPEAKEKISSGNILYAGKYSAPDYELLISKECNLAIENTMIYHNPDVKEKLESLGIPVIVERSSYEENPLGKLEWIKLYGILYGKLEEANQFFEQQVSEISEIANLEETRKKVAIFSIDSSGMVTVRKPGDYLSKMVDMAGGVYIPSQLQGVDENSLSTIKITMEDFYVEAVDADILIYNSTIEGEVSSIDELVKKAEILADFNAVQSGEVYCLEKAYFQQSSDVAEFIEDVHNILCGEENILKHIYKLEE